jgi:hypothetical protein
MKKIITRIRFYYTGEQYNFQTALHTLVWQNEFFINTTTNFYTSCYNTIDGNKMLNLQAITNLCLQHLITS